MTTIKAFALHYPVAEVDVFLHPLQNSTTSVAMLDSFKTA